MIVKNSLFKDYHLKSGRAIWILALRGTGRNPHDRVEKFPASMARFLVTVHNYQRVAIWKIKTLNQRK